MSSEKLQHARNGAGGDHESLSHAPLPESPSQAPALTSTSQSEAVSTEHLVWASLIKEQHRYLQAAVQSGVSGSGTAVTAMGALSCLTASAPPPSYREELKAWRCTLTGEAAAQRLSAYAEAMHHLATLYWNPSATPLAGHSGGADDSGRARVEPGAHGGRAGAFESTAPRLGEKRKRSSDTAGGVQTPPSAVVIGEAMPATVTATMSDTHSRHYSDRLGYCLQSIASYYLGEAETEGCGEGTADGAPHAADCRPSAAAQSPSPPCFRVCVEQTRFRQLPGVFARVVKPLRRLFFQRYGRMATEAEVGQLISVCTPSRDDSCSIAPKKSRAGSFSCSSSSTDSSGGSTTAVCAARQLIDADVDARAIVEESTWRRSEHTAWATALHYTRGAPHPTPTSAPAPLWTLDVGSCYGPFFGTILSRAAPLAPVPLHVTSMDLAPYQGAAGCDTGSNGVPSPCVWRADWLQMEFFAEEPETDEAVRGCSTGVAFGTAEEGRVRYQRQRPASSLADGGGNSGLHPCDSREGSAGNAAQRSLAATAVRLESYDAVFFCLLLSYIPTPRLRFLACIHAFLALKEGGLLVIVSTRTQGPRRRNWMSEWTACLASIGFQRVQQSIQEKLVGMSFAKVSPSAEVRRSWATAEGRAAWIESLMTSSAALEGLRITADDARSCADI
ncbi:conserved hypothetical protein [Leishmania major strain Friedlin]|uniref:Probable methyltransferase BMT2 homolog n=1 Tax=Leishmania major TaxID=5664 RepID=Q4QB47_LEIMA|nr:conserved hypothetical protein [Leishmania major strain Friedlin]CAG9574328.1 Probable_methyltransferase_BTM2_homolog [Leishmania major strain Friedlin]CAJ04677.1 conserved hypothetical protein [Leishmania major strain Friedlin]|eukprot:XP_001683451.1 conserved hypothetical protein [Leishmania major strain Friedlin]